MADEVFPDVMQRLDRLLTFLEKNEGRLENIEKELHQIATIVRGQDGMNGIAMRVVILETDVKVLRQTLERLEKAVEKLDDRGDKKVATLKADLTDNKRYEQGQFWARWGLTIAILGALGTFLGLVISILIAVYK